MNHQTNQIYGYLSWCTSKYKLTQVNRPKGNKNWLYQNLKVNKPKMYCRLCAGVKCNKFNQPPQCENVNDNELNNKVKICVNIDLTEAGSLPKHVENAQKVLTDLLLVPKAEPFIDVVLSPVSVKDEEEISVQVKEEPESIIDKHSHKKTGSNKMIGNVKRLKRKVTKDTKLRKCAKLKSNGGNEHKVTTKREVGDVNFEGVSTHEQLFIKNYTWHCVECEEKFNAVIRYQKHFSVEHPWASIKYKCNLCLKSYEHKVTFQKHLKSHRDKDKYPCKECGKKFYTSSHLKQHQSRHSSNRDFECDVCGKYMKTKVSLQTHRSRHFRSSERTFKCDICPKTFHSLGTLNVHLTIHNGAKQHTCEVCGRSFMFKGTLVGHMAGVHNDTTPFKCTLCTRSFKTRQRFKRHAKIHTGIKNHKCETCGKFFRERANLILHNRVHTGEEPYECGHCKKRFKLRNLLRIHLRQHTGERPYSCKECNHDFTDWSNYSKHMRGRHHKDIRSQSTKLIQKQQQSLTNRQIKVEEILLS